MQDIERDKKKRKLEFTPPEKIFVEHIKLVDTLDMCNEINIHPRLFGITEFTVEEVNINGKPDTISDKSIKFKYVYVPSDKVNIVRDKMNVIDKITVTKKIKEHAKFHSWRKNEFGFTLFQFKYFCWDEFIADNHVVVKLDDTTFQVISDDEMSKYRFQLAGPVFNRVTLFESIFRSLYDSVGKEFTIHVSKGMRESGFFEYSVIRFKDLCSDAGLEFVVNNYFDVSYVKIVRSSVSRNGSNVIEYDSGDRINKTNLFK